MTYATFITYSSDPGPEFVKFVATKNATSFTNFEIVQNLSSLFYV